MILHCTRKLLWLVIVTGLVASPFAAPRADVEPRSDNAPQDLSARILAEDRNRELRVVGLYRIRVSFPQRVSTAVGAMVVRQPADYDCSTVCKYTGLFVQAEPGYSGGALSAGYAVVMGEKRRNEHFLSRVYLGYGVRTALLRTWNDADLTPPDQTLVGIEGDFTVIGVNFSLGLFRNIGSPEPADPWVVSGGVGWGF